MARISEEANKVCRLCLSEDEGILFPANKLIDSTLTVDDIERLTSVRIIEKGRSPYAVCIDCNNKLRKFNVFRSFCLSNDVLFRKRFSLTLADDSRNIDDGSSSLAYHKNPELASNHCEITEQIDSIDEYNNDEFDVKIEVEEIVQYDQSIDDAALEDEDPKEVVDLTLDPSDINDTLPNNHHSQKREQNATTSSTATTKQSMDSNERDSKKYPLPKQLCSLCGKLIHNMGDHMLSHTKEPRFSCQYCPMRCSRKSYLKLHVEAVHMKRVLKSCEICNKGFSYIESYDAHMRAKHNYGESFECKICNLKFRHKGGLRGHNNRKHNDQTNCSCTICGMTFQDKRGLRAHGRVHSDEKPFACRYCPKRFKSPNAHRAHELIHKGVVFPCTMCDKTYTYKSLLNIHMLG
uniref:Protein krueppel n=1 Tax=Anopheles christyi TaxID=43041 RepID=A0A182K2W2_9DIPT